MSDIDPAQVIHTRIWQEEPEPDNPFATRKAYCRGYDVFGEMVGNARWVEMLCLLFRDDLLDPPALDALEALAVALANPGPRDPSVHASMCGGVAGSSAAASLMAALAVGAGRYRGSRDVFDAMVAWSACGTHIDKWETHLRAAPPETADIWPLPERAAGFDPHGVSAATSVCQLLETLVRKGGTPRLRWLEAQREALEAIAELPLDLTGVAAAAFSDFGFSPAEGEMLFLLLRLPGAAAHALEQEGNGFRRFPFYPVELTDDPTTREAR